LFCIQEKGRSPLLLPAFTLSELVIKIDKNTKGVAMFDRTQWVLAGMSIALSVQLSQNETRFAS
jgi:hypothetical protein